MPFKLVTFNSDYTVVVIIVDTCLYDENEWFYYEYFLNKYYKQDNWFFIYFYQIKLINISLIKAIEIIYKLLMICNNIKWFGKE